MKIFLSWSGPTSRAVAHALHGWLPNVIQQVRPWMSANDLIPGVRWQRDVGQQLDESSFGVLCLTPDNLVKPWILFEAGALGKRIESSRVVPYFFHVDPSDVSGPLSQFQGVAANEGGTRSLVESIHDAMTAASTATMTPERLRLAFEKWWPELQSFLGKVDVPAGDAPHARPTTDPGEARQEEMLAIVRGMQRDLADLQSAFGKNARVGGGTSNSATLGARSQLPMTGNLADDAARLMASARQSGLPANSLVFQMKQWDELDRRVRAASRFGLTALEDATGGETDPEGEAP